MRHRCREEPIGALPASAAAPLEEDHSGGDRNIQRGNLAGHGNANDNVAMLSHLFVQAPAFASQYEHGTLREIGVIVRLLAPLVQPVDPVAALFQLLECA